MRIIKITTASAPPFGSRTLLVHWMGSQEAVREFAPPGMSDTEAVRTLERKRGRKARAWHSA